MNKYYWIQQALSRLRTGKPAFFAKLQTGAIALLSVCSIVAIAGEFGFFELPEKLVLACEALAVFLTGVGLTAQLPNNDQPKQ